MVKSQYLDLDQPDLDRPTDLDLLRTYYVKIHQYSQNTLPFC